MNAIQVRIVWTECKEFQFGDIFFDENFIGRIFGCRYDPGLKRFRTYDLELCTFEDDEGIRSFKRIDLGDHPLNVALMVCYGFAMRDQFAISDLLYEQELDVFI